MLVGRLKTATTAAADAANDCAAGQRTGARAALGKVDRQMTAIRSRLRTRRARKLIPQDLAGEIGETARAISGDVRALRSSVSCP
jgi:hypothetical protein